MNLLLVFISKQNLLKPSVIIVITLLFKYKINLEELNKLYILILHNSKVCMCSVYDCTYMKKIHSVNYNYYYYY
jgi:hypothetical protein